MTTKVADQIRIIVFVRIFNRRIITAIAKRELAMSVITSNPLKLTVPYTYRISAIITGVIVIIINVLILLPRVTAVNAKQPMPFLVITIVVRTVMLQNVVITCRILISVAKLYRGIVTEGSVVIFKNTRSVKSIIINNYNAKIGIFNISVLVRVNEEGNGVNIVVVPFGDYTFNSIIE